MTTSTAALREPLRHNESSSSQNKRSDRVKSLIGEPLSEDRAAYDQLLAF